ncbi:MAG: hypothetical protein ACK4EY_05125 [Flavipsychrobacter sp.]
MDRKQLESHLIKFELACKERGRPISDMCIQEAFPGDDSTSFVIQVKAPWVDEMYCSDALDFLFDVLWDTVSEEIRRSVFSIEVLDSKEELHCVAERPEQK